MAPILIFVLLVVYAIGIRIELLPYDNMDIFWHIGKWYAHLNLYGPEGLSTITTDYLPYQYALLLATLLPVPKLIAIKLVSIAFDGLLAVSAYLLIRHFYPKGYAPYFAGIVSVVLPTVVINSAMWGQSDAAYGSFTILSVYFALKRKYGFMWISWAIALTFKLQPIFLLPWFALFPKRKDVFVNALLIIPTIGLVFLPYVILGKSYTDLAAMYFAYINKYTTLTYNAANIYQWIPVESSREISMLGTAITLTLTAILFFILNKRKAITDDRLLLSAYCFSLLIPFFLPHMHERYFFLAEILALLSAFRYRQIFWHIPVFQFVSVNAYMGFLYLGTTLVPIPFTVFPLSMLLMHALYLVLYSGTRIDNAYVA